MTSPPTARPKDRSFARWLADMPPWKKAALTAGVLAVAVGGIWSLTSGDPTPASGGAGAGSGLGSSLLEGNPPPWPGGPGTGQPAPGVPAGEEPTSKGIFRLGFSFLCGFCVGAFLRSALRLAAIAIGFWFVATFALSYYGIVQVDWQQMDTLWNRFAANVEQEWGSFQRFMTGSLPAAGLAVTGLFVGLKRH
jgi:uncharacterized membrane protein (Fun14 family)